jgi:hypothetical protein
MVEESAFRDAGALEDLVERGGRIPLLQDQLVRLLEDPFAGRSRVPRHFSYQLVF